MMIKAYKNSGVYEITKGKGFYVVKHYDVNSVRYFTFNNKEDFERYFENKS